MSDIFEKLSEGDKEVLESFQLSYTTGLNLIWYLPDTDGIVYDNVFDPSEIRGIAKALNAVADLLSKEKEGC